MQGEEIDRNQYLWITFCGLALTTLKQATFQSCMKILSLVNKIIVFQYLGLHAQENDSGITLDQMNYSGSLKTIAPNYYNKSNSKRKVAMDEWPNKGRYCF